MYGKRLRSLRKEHRWTIEYVAQMVDKGKSTYAGYETETRQPPIEVIIQLAKIFEVSSDYILGLSDDRDPKKIESNLREYLNKEGLNWDGKPIPQDVLSPIKDLLILITSKQ